MRPIMLLEPLLILALLGGTLALNACDVCECIGSQITNCQLSLQSVPSVYPTHAIFTLNLSNTLITSIPSNAFRDLTMLQALYLGNTSITSVPSDAFASLSTLRILYLSKNAITAIPSFHLHTPLLSTLNLADTNITTIPSNAFSTLTGLRSLSLPSTIQVIERDAFVGPCLESLSMGFVPCATLDAQAFSNLSGLTWLSLPVVELNARTDQLFQALTDLRWLSLGRSHHPADNDSPLTSIPPGAFLHLTTGIKSINLKNSQVSSIADNAFETLTSLTSLDISNTRLTSISGSTFAGLSALPKLYLAGNPIESISDHAFSHLGAVTELSLSYRPNATVGPLAFNGITPMLRTLKLPISELNSLSSQLFAAVPRLELLDLSSSPLTLIPTGAFTYLSALSELDAANAQISNVAPNAFSGLESLRKLSLYGNPLSTLPSHTYAGLGALNTLYFGGKHPIWSVQSNAFAQLPALRTLSLSLMPNTTIAPDAFVGLQGVTMLSLWIPSLGLVSDQLFAATPSLSTLYVYFLTSLPAAGFANLPRLKTLKIIDSFSQLSEKISESALQGLTSLETLTLEAQTKIPSKLIDGLPALQHLSLVVRSAPISTSAIANLPSLTSLSVDGSVSKLDSSFANLPTLTSLTLLGIAPDTVVDPHAFGGLPRLSELELVIDQFSPATTQVFAQLSNLLNLKVKVATASVVPSHAFAGLASLESLSIRSRNSRGYYSSITTISSQALSGLTQLTTFSLTRNHALNAVPASLFHGLTKLRRVDLSENALVTLPPGLFQGLTMLKVVHLEPNLLSSSEAPPSTYSYVQAGYTGLMECHFACATCYGAGPGSCCSAHCLRCDSSTNCTECYSGFVLHAGVCTTSDSRAEL
ncbi:hypothetical protein CAOG_03315 [Capsaspora owczarzaki ATCC 30864]|uniref:hypothetical protein n=1 Tax=Capsaspora owczarzaki (strain ATCC 30864) TaxID=595528 RepID=UPI00035267D6|nr:hypothetical protein CAOG_03315 [Capsaspora owczarzaki ATCC 30864]|eukprot:XP_004364154.2 hypothetical protein CAOG_03315 [Capsaspora owczarzaki ATCC 30864]